jgi:predicted dehydrogenase
MTTSLIRVAIVGAGNMAREHARAFAGIAGVELTGIFSRTAERAEKLAQEVGIKTVCRSLDELYDKGQPQLVIVTVFEMAMREVALAALECPWAVMLEKPPGLNLDQAKAINTAARAKQRKVVVGLNRRFLSSTRAALADLNANDKPRFIHVQDQQSFATAKAIGHPPDVIHHWMYANSIHLVDYLLCFGRGRVRSVTPIAPFSEDARVVLTRVDFDSGDLGLYEAIWDGPGPWACTVTTAAKRWEMRPLESAVYQNAGERTLNRVEPSANDRDFKPGFRMQAEHAIAAALGQPSEIPTLDTALETMQLIHAIYSR